MSIVRVGSPAIGSHTGSGTTQDTSAFSATAGNTLVVTIRIGGGAGNVPTTISDTAGNTYILANEDSSFDPYLGVWYCSNCLGNASNVVHVVGSAGGWMWVVAVQYSGMGSATVDSGSKTFRSVSGTIHVTSSAFSTSTGAELVLALASDGLGLTYSAGTDFTLISGTSGLGGVEDYITSISLSSYSAEILASGTGGSSILTVALIPSATAFFLNFKPVWSVAVERATTW